MFPQIHTISYPYLTDRSLKLSDFMFRQFKSGYFNNINHPSQNTDEKFTSIYKCGEEITMKTHLSHNKQFNFPKCKDIVALYFIVCIIC